jgi:hypothetical protein
MSSLAELPDLVGFFSYSREDDEDSGGKLSKLRERIQAELRGQLGRTKRDFRLWQDKVAIAHGELWEDRIKSAVAESVFFIPIITPTAVRSYHCKFEFDSFLAREKELGRSNLVFPILYIPVPALTGDRWRQDPLLAVIGSRQYEQWQDLRHLDASSTEVAQRVEKFCANICRALQQEWLSPEERQQADARRVAETERRRQQEAEIKQRADEEERRRKAEAEERRRDEKLRKLEEEARRAAKKAQHQTQSEQEPQQQVKPWLLPLIGAVVAALPMVVLSGLLLNSSNTNDVQDAWIFLVLSITYALWGGAAGMLVPRLGIPKAVAIPAIAAFGLTVIVFTFGVKNIKDILWWKASIGAAAVCVPSYFLTWLAFWLHSLWVRKRRLREAGLVP